MPTLKPDKGLLGVGKFFESSYAATVLGGIGGEDVIPSFTAVYAYALRERPS